MSTLKEKIAETYRRIRERGEDAVWISLVPEEESLARAEALESQGGLPLKGLTFAIKDNIDLEGLPTTAACPEFAFTPNGSAVLVKKLIAAGAIPIGKTNLDQFATGLNGTRSPYGIPRSVFNPDYISGGSSSGSAVSVATGLVDFALGTDTAGSGRVPAAFNDLIGFKPTCGRWSTNGLLPACRTLDCITVFSKTLGLALRVDVVAKGWDETDPFSRREPAAPILRGKRVGVLPENQREFFGNTEYQRLYAEAIAKAESLGWNVVEFDYEPFRKAAALLYSGPWVAERYAAIKGFITTQPDAIHPVVRSIIEGAAKYDAVDAFESRYQLAALARETESVWKSLDSLLLPTAGAFYTVDEMLANPAQLNTNLGYYTNFVNLLDLCALAIPAGFGGDGLPFGITLIGPAWSEATQAALAAEFLAESINLPSPGIRLAVVGAHLRGQPLNSQLVNLGASFLEATTTSADYRLYALPNTQPRKPGLVRVEAGAAIELEIWELTADAFGRFVQAVPPPLCIGNVQLKSGDFVKGFLCEEFAIWGAEDISSFGGWRAYLASHG